MRVWFAAPMTTNTSGATTAPGVAFLEVQKHVAGDKELRLVEEVGLQHGECIDEGLDLESALRHRPTVRAGVVNRGGDWGGSVHRRVLRCGASARWEMRNVTVP